MTSSEDRKTLKKAVHGLHEEAQAVAALPLGMMTVFRDPAIKKLIINADDYDLSNGANGPYPGLPGGILAVLLMVSGRAVPKPFLAKENRVSRSVCT
jgi:hypothetical protein